VKQIVRCIAEITFRFCLLVTLPFAGQTSEHQTDANPMDLGYRSQLDAPNRREAADPNADRGPHHFSYWLYPHAGNWKTALTVHRSYEANNPLLAMQVETHSGSLPARHSFVSVSPSNVILTAVKKAEDGNAPIFRVHESDGKQSDVRLNVPEGGIAATATNLMEQLQSSDSVSLSSGRVSVTIHSFDVQTISVSYPPSQHVQNGDVP